MYQIIDLEALRNYNRVLAYRPLSSSFLWLYLESYKVIPNRNYLGAYEYSTNVILRNPPNRNPPNSSALNYPKTLIPKPS